MIKHKQALDVWATVLSMVIVSFHVLSIGQIFLLYKFWEVKLALPWFGVWLVTGCLVVSIRNCPRAAKGLGSAQAQTVSTTTESPTLEWRLSGPRKKKALSAGKTKWWTSTWMIHEVISMNWCRRSSTFLVQNKKNVKLPPLFLLLLFD